MQENEIGIKTNEDELGIYLSEVNVAVDTDAEMPKCPTCGDTPSIRYEGDKAPFASCSCSPEPMPKVISKTNHDSLWIKVSWSFGWGKIKITRNGETFEATSQKALDEILNLWDNTDPKKSFGERIAIVQKAIEEVSA